MTNSSDEHDPAKDFLGACHKGDLQEVKNTLALSGLLRASSWTQNSKRVGPALLNPFSSHVLNALDLSDGLVCACDRNNLQLAQYLLSSPELKIHADIHVDNGNALSHACVDGHLELIKYLLTSTELVEHADIHANDDHALRTACNQGHFELVKYLLSSPELVQHANIHANDDGALRTACFKGHLELVKYLLTSPELSRHANIHANNGMALRAACGEGHLEVVNFLLWDMNMQVSDATYQAMSDEVSREELRQICNKRDLLFKMNHVLEQKPDPTSRGKPKI